RLSCFLNNPTHNPRRGFGSFRKCSPISICASVRESRSPAAPLCVAGLSERRSGAIVGLRVYLGRSWRPRRGGCRPSRSSLASRASCSSTASCSGLLNQFSGIVLLAVGIWGKVGLEVYFSLLNEKATNVPYVLIGTGTVVVLLGTFGCFATCRGSTWMLKLIKDSFKNNFEAAMKSYDGTKDERSKAVDTIQSTLHCCGVSDYTDWNRTAYYKQKGIPMSCCKSLGNCTIDDLKNPAIAKGKVYEHGCFRLVIQTMDSKMGIVAGISFGVACFQLGGIVLACCLSRSITNNQYEMV
uniref:Tetraspanin-6 n=1 Tax=Podarcis muralis TaxID=64176 RepID=A0A670JWR3_PODMU